MVKQHRQGINYVRFSSKPQEEADSLRRQVEATYRWAAQLEMEIDQKHRLYDRGDVGVPSDLGFVDEDDVEEAIEFIEELTENGHHGLDKLTAEYLVERGGEHAAGASYYDRQMVQVALNKMRDVGR